MPYKNGQEEEYLPDCPGFEELNQYLLVKEHLRNGCIFCEEDLDRIQKSMNIDIMELFERALLETELPSSAEVLPGVRRFLSPLHDQEDKFQNLLEVALSLLKVPYGLIQLYDNRTNTLVAQAIHWTTQEEEKKIKDFHPVPVEEIPPDSRGLGITRRAAYTREIQLIPDVTADKDYFPYVGGMRSELTIPLLYEDKLFRKERLLGVLTLESPELDAFSQTQVQEAVNFAREVSSLIHYDILIGGLKTCICMLQELRKIRAASLIPKDFDQYFEDIAGKIANSVGRSVCSIWILDRKTARLWILGATGFSKDYIASNELPLRASVAGRVAESGHYEIVPDVLEDGMFQNKEVARELELKSLLSIPMRYPPEEDGRTGEVIGVLHIFTQDPDQSFTEVDISLIQQAAAEVAAIYKEKFELRQKDVMARVGDIFARSFTINEISSKLVGLIKESLGADGCSIFLRDEGANYALVATTGIVNPRKGRPLYRLGEGLTGWVAKAGKPLRVNKLDETINIDCLPGDEPPIWRNKYSEIVGEGPVKSYLAVPILLNGMVTGVIRVCRNETGFRFNVHDEELLSNVAEQFSCILGRVINLEMENAVTLEQIVTRSVRFMFSNQQKEMLEQINFLFPEVIDAISAGQWKSNKGLFTELLKMVLEGTGAKWAVLLRYSANIKAPGLKPVAVHRNNGHCPSLCTLDGRSVPAVTYVTGGPCTYPRSRDSDILPAFKEARLEIGVPIRSRETPLVLVISTDKPSFGEMAEDFLSVVAGYSTASFSPGGDEPGKNSPPLLYSPSE